MAKLNGTAENGTVKSEAELVEAEAKWGTWEELLLACAVNRYGTKSWDSVALEIQKRSSSSPDSLLLTPLNCRKRYLDLTRRFFIKNDKNNIAKGGGDVDAAANGGDGSIITTDESVPLLEELRKLRVAELRRELERYDLSIVSLQSKVKKMKEERERSTRDSENREENSSDQRKSEEAETPERDAKEQNEEVKANLENSPVSVAGEPVSGKDERPMNESISADGRVEDLGIGGNKDAEEEEPGRTGDENEEPQPTGEDKPDREEDSCYGSSDSVDKEEPEAEQVLEKVKVEPESVSDSPELVESVAESKGGGGGEEEATTKECSDVQSSATKSRRDGGDSDNMLRGSSNDDDLENKDRFAAVKTETSVGSQPLIDVLEKFKGHKLGSVFLRRLDSQETPNYKNLIRQHVDLEKVELRVKEGTYVNGNLKFFRDLLLLVNNAIVFYSKNTPEFLAAIKLRQLITNEMAHRNAKSDSSSEKQTSLQKISLPKKQNFEPSDSLLLKPNVGGPLIVCRKRSSIAAKASASSSGSDKKREQTTVPAEEIAGLDVKQLLNQPPAKVEEPRLKKKRSRDRFASVSTNLKKNGKSGSNANSKQTSVTNSEKNQAKVGSSSQQLEQSETKNQSTLKKRSAANFLNRMKQSSSDKNNTLLDTLKNSPLSASNNSKGGSEHKKSEIVKGSGRKEQVSTRSSDAKQAKEKGSPAKKTVGRPPKRGAPPPPPSGKRGRDDKESETSASKHQRKRSRK